ncbi:MAG: glycosyltransferase family 2 protein [Prevotella sp.]
MNTPLLSIVVPVYRVEATLEKCVQSIVTQSFADFQLVLVDDGSPDACPLMCDAWARKDPRITVIHKSNGGLSDARNAGIDIAKGELLMFVDSDDLLFPDTLMPLVEQMQNHPEVDILEFPVVRHFADGRCHKLGMGDDTFDDMSEYWLEAKAYLHTYAWNKVYRKALFDNVRFPKGKVFEDAWTLPLLLEHAKVVGLSPKGNYVYIENKEGITSRASVDDERMLLSAHLRVLGTPLCPDVKSLPQRVYYMHLVDIQMVVSEMSGEAPILPFYRVALRGLSFRQMFKAIVINILGLRFLCACNYYFRRFLPRK